MPVRVFALIVAVGMVFVMPWPLSVVGILGAALALPPAGILLGLFADAFYWSSGPGFSLPMFSIAGLVASGIAFLVHRFVKTRIMDA